MSISGQSKNFKVFSQQHYIIQDQLNKQILYDLKIVEIQNNYFVLQTHRKMSLQTLHHILSKHIAIAQNDVEIYSNNETNSEQDRVKKEYKQILIQISKNHEYYYKLINSSEQIDGFLWFHLVQNQDELENVYKESLRMYEKQQQIFKKQQNLQKPQEKQQQIQGKWENFPNFSFIQTNSDQNSSTQNNSFHQAMLENQDNMSTMQPEEIKNDNAAEQIQQSLQNTQNQPELQKNNQINLSTRHYKSITDHITKTRESRSKSADNKCIQYKSSPYKKKTPTVNKSPSQQQQQEQQVDNNQ